MNQRPESAPYRWIYGASSAAQSALDLQRVPLNSQTVTVTGLFGLMDDG
jgi:hypothetical protein